MLKRIKYSNKPLSSLTTSRPYVAPVVSARTQRSYPAQGQHLWALASALFLVAVPVFFQAPLVRVLPWVSLGITGIWWGLGWKMMQAPRTRFWGDLLIGFSWTWLAGSIYWGWLRSQPLLHMPVEGFALPIVAVCLFFNWSRIGSYFYLGSVLGTALTDLYFYSARLVPSWVALMEADAQDVPIILHQAVDQVQTPANLIRAAALLGILLLLGLGPLRIRQSEWWAFGGAVLSTIIVDSLFWLAASFA